MDFTEDWPDTCSHIGMAARTGNLDLLQQLIKEGRPVDVADNRGWRPLHEASAVSSNIECLRELLNCDQTNVNWTTHEHESALLLVCKRRTGSEANEYAQLLLRHGANPNIVDIDDDNPLLKAVKSENNYLVELLLLHGADVNAHDMGGWSALHEASIKPDVSLVEFLLSQGANVCVQDECGITPLFAAAQHGRTQNVEKLLLFCKEHALNIIDLGAKDLATPLMIAAQQGFSSCVKLLLDFGANPNLITTDHVTALHLALEKNNDICLKLLINAMNLKPMIKMFHPDTYEENTSMICPLHFAVEWSSNFGLQALIDAGFSVDSLDSSKDTNIPPRRILNYLPEHETALCYAIDKTDRASVEILLKAGANPNPVNRKAYHPLLKALMRPRRQEFFQLLLDYGTDVNYHRLFEPYDSITTSEVLLFSFLTMPKFLKMLLFVGCDPTPALIHEKRIFAKLSKYMISNQNMSLKELCNLLLRFTTAEKELLDTPLGVVNHHKVEGSTYPSTLKKFCQLKIRQYMYSIHGVKFVQQIASLPLPCSLKDLLLCYDVKPLKL